MQTYANYYYIATFKRCYMFILLFLNSYYHESKQFCIMYTEEGVSVVEKKDESHFPFDSDRVFHLPDLSWDISISHSI